MSKSGRPGRSGEFFTLLEELRAFRAGPLAGDPGDRALARAAAVSPTTIGEWLRGRRFPHDIGQVGFPSQRGEILFLAELGDLDGLRARANAGDDNAAGRLALWLAKRGNLDGLRARTEAGDEHAAVPLAGLLEQRGDRNEAIQVLRVRADAGDDYAAGQLALWLVKRGDLGELRARTEAGDENAAGLLLLLLIELGRREEGERLRRFGLNPDGSIASS
jgi:hypothetical protein